MQWTLFVDKLIFRMDDRLRRKLIGIYISEPKGDFVDVKMVVTTADENAFYSLEIQLDFKHQTVKGLEAFVDTYAAVILSGKIPASHGIRMDTTTDAALVWICENIYLPQILTRIPPEPSWYFSAMQLKLTFWAVHTEFNAAVHKAASELLPFLSNIKDPKPRPD
jgi:hypothetical protein